MKTAQIAGLALGTAAIEILVVVIASRFSTPLPSGLVVLIGGSAALLVVAWYLGSRGFAFAFVLLTFYLTRLLAAVPL